MADSEASFKIMNYIEQNPMAALGTVNDDGTPHGAIVYICAISNQTVCFITKNLTQKYINLTERPMVSLTIGNDKDSSALQITGRAAVINDPRLMDTILQKITRVHARMVEWLPPLAKLRAGNYAIIGVKVTAARLGEFKGLDIGSHEIFTEI
jgi:general stress protein 26